MKPNIQLAEAATPDGGSLTLHEHDGSFCIRLNGEELMNSLVTTSELLLGEVATDLVSGHVSPRVLIGGLGLGYTLRSVLERVGPEGRVEIAELMPEVVAWNRGHLCDLNGSLLDDPRVQLFVEDFWEVLNRAGKKQFDALVLDIDNGPTALVQRQNARVYNDQGIRLIHAALKPGGRAAIWSARPDEGFAERLDAAGFQVKAVPAKLYANAKRCGYTIYVGDK
ncbi:MAG: spermidine synthase [Verrucomicrobiales bacterium]|jgi:spermidine synthase|nr:spermidine synthase [Verrucomicrobiales bacterium]